MTLIRIEVRAWLLALLLLLGSGSLAVAAGSLPRSNRPRRPPSSFTVAGSLTLIGKGAIWWSDDEHCRGAGEFADIREGARVFVRGGEMVEEYLGAGRLSDGSAVEMDDGAGCEFSFEILDVPTGQNVYILGIGRYTQRYAEESVYNRYLDLTLSSPADPGFFATASLDVATSATVPEHDVLAVAHQPALLRRLRLPQGGQRRLPG